MVCDLNLPTLEDLAYSANQHLIRIDAQSEPSFRDCIFAVVGEAAHSLIVGDNEYQVQGDAYEVIALLESLPDGFGWDDTWEALSKFSDYCDCGECGVCDSEPTESECIAQERWQDMCQEEYGEKHL